ncbi:MAG: hypothetical protein WBQ24_21015 [Xanthobacteraceae bacterium]|jgi:hypothetical protein
MRQLYLAATAVMTIAAATSAVAAQRSSLASCHEAVNGLVSLFDGKMDNTALYRETFATVVHTCGPAAPAQPAQPAAVPDRSACDDLATAMTDLIEDDKMNTADFVKARTAFAQSCAPR